MEQVEAIRTGIINSRDKDHVRVTDFAISSWLTTALPNLISDLGGDVYVYPRLQDGDTHKIFAHVDADESGHLTHEELYHLLGVPKGEPVSQQRCALDFMCEVCHRPHES